MGVYNMAIEPGRKSNCIAFTVNGVRYPLPTGDVNEIPMEVRRQFAKRFYEADARLEQERQNEYRACVPQVPQ